MQSKIILNEKLFIARGGERNCYQHPTDNKKVIKILYKKNGVYSYGGKRNDLEYKYYEYLEKEKISFLHISKCYDFINTNIGIGLVFERISDYNGKTSLSFTKSIIQNKLDNRTEKVIIKKLEKYILENNILFIDNTLDNILCCEYEKNKFRLIIIDGLGAKRVGLKHWLYLHCKIYTKYKAKKQWNIFIRKYNSFKEKNTNYQCNDRAI